MSERIIDTNGWIEIQNNPITRVGVFQYSGSSLGKQFDSNKMYNVYRPAESLEDPACVSSFRLLPWTNDHPETLLGNPSKGYVAAEDKGVLGVTGEEIYFDGEFLRANLKVFGQELADEIKSGKKQLSAGYNFLCIIQKGVYNGIEYEVIQKDIRGNHLSLVDEGRTGPEVSVLDSKEFPGGNMKPEDNLAEMPEKNTMENYDEESAGTSLAGLAEKLMSFSAKIDSLEKKLDILMSAESQQGEVVSSQGNEDQDKDKEKSAGETKAADEETKEKECEKTKGMDAIAFEKSIMSRLSQRNDLATDLSQIIGAFDSSEMNLEDVSKYGIKKLGLSCKPGHEKSMLDGYLAAKRKNHASVSTQHALDSRNPATKEMPSFIKNYFKGE